MTAKYASQTEVSPEKTRSEIEAILKRYGADQFGYMTTSERVAIAFQAHGKRVKFILPLPDRKHRSFTHRKGSWQMRTEKQIESAYAQAVRSCWRALLLVIKAKLEAVEAEITTFEEEFLAHIVLPNGRTVADNLLPRIADAYQTGEMPPLQIGFDR
jgi:hypothetical protein